MYNMFCKASYFSFLLVWFIFPSWSSKHNTSNAKKKLETKPIQEGIPQTRSTYHHSYPLSLQMNPKAKIKSTQIMVPLRVLRVVYITYVISAVCWVLIHVQEESKHRVQWGTYKLKLSSLLNIINCPGSPNLQSPNIKVHHHSPQIIR